MVELNEEEVKLKPKDDAAAKTEEGAKTDATKK